MELFTPNSPNTSRSGLYSETVPSTLLRLCHVQTRQSSAESPVAAKAIDSSLSGHALLRQSIHVLAVRSVTCQTDSPLLASLYAGKVLSVPDLVVCCVSRRSNLSRFVDIPDPCESEPVAVVLDSNWQT